jgi:hydrogenase maturation protease
VTRLLLAVGNPGRGDDGLGHALALRVEVLQQAGDLPDLQVEHRYQLNVEDAELIARFEQVLVADAALDARAPAELRPVAPAPGLPFTTHGLTLPELLALCHSLYGRLPELRLLALQGREFEFGEGLSAVARRSLDEAVRLVCALPPG